MAADPTAPRQRLFLIDGSGFIFRAFHALPPLSRPDGTPVNAVFGYTNMLSRLLADMRDDKVAVIFDNARVTFRSEIFPAYKANRSEPPEDLIPQFALVREATRAFNVPSIELPGFEADDLIASYAQAALAEGDEVIIISSDKDLMQLIRDGVSMLDPMKNRSIGPAEVLEKFGVTPDKVVDVQALCGDATDNVPGVPGIGVKTAAELIGLYGDLDTLLERAHEIKQPKRRETLMNNADLARVSRELVRLRADAPLPMSLAELDKRHPDHDVLRAFLTEQGFRALIQKLDGGQLATVHRDAAPRPVAVAANGATPSAVEAQYELVTTEDALDRWIARATEAGIVAFDTETTSLDVMIADLVGVSLSTAPGLACYIPLGHVAPGDLGGLALGGARPTQIPLDVALAKLRPLLVDESVLKIGHNIKYDMAILARYGLSITPWDDTMLISYALAGGLHGHGMDELAKLHLDYAPISYDTVTGTGKSRISFAEVALDQALAYAAEDADVTLRLHRFLKPQLPTARVTTIYETIERPLVPVVMAMERRGVRVDPDALRRLSGEFAQKMGALESEIHMLAGESFNIASPKQLGVVLFEKLKLPGGKKTKTGDYSTNSDVLEPLAEQGHPLPAQVLEWRQLAKLKSTYADALVGQIDRQTGRVHTSFSMAATSTGRLSSTDPNLQNIPVRTEEGRKIRSAFIADEGCRLLSVDYSQIELRLLAEIADIGALKQAFQDGVDIHALTASQVFGVPLETLDKETRRKAKAINFGIIYGISAFGLAKHLDCGPGEAKGFIDRYFERYPGIRAFMEDTKAFARRHGYVVTLFGRKCHMAGIQDKNPARRGFAERQAINAPIQGTAADVIKRAMLRIPGALDAARLNARLLLQVHDELLFETPEAEVEETSALVVKVMEGAASFSVPLIAEAGSGLTWAQAH